MYNRRELTLCVEIDVSAANSLFADPQISLLTSRERSPRRPRSPESQVHTMTAPTHVIIPPTPDSAVGPLPERERAFSDPQVPLARPSTSPPLASEEADDRLSHHWRETPRRSSSLLRRLSRSNHGRSSSLPSELRRSHSDPPPRSRGDEDDAVFIPEQLQRGMEMLRVTRKKVTKRICSIDPIKACVSWDSKNSSRCESP
jgi:hypothetical protein